MAEWRLVLLMALLLAALTSVPYILGWAARDASRFSGVLFDEVDINCYLAHMQQASHGQFLFHNPFTPEPHGAVFFNAEWLVGGWIAALPGSSPEMAFHALRLAGIFALALGCYRLCAEIFASVLMRRLVFVALLTGGGFGWMLSLRWVSPYLWRVQPVDISAGLHPFFSMLFSSHFLLGQAAETFALVQILRAERSRAIAHYVAAGLLVAVAGAIRPYDMLVLLVASALYLLATAISKRERAPSMLARRALPLLVPLPLLAYYLWLFHVHPVYRWWNIQGWAAPPYPASLAASIGLVFLLLLGALGSLGDFRDKPHARVLLACALLATVGVTYGYPILRFSSQAATMLPVPAALVATMCLEGKVLALARRRAGVTLLALLLLVNAGSSVVLYKHALRDVARGAGRIDRALVEAYSWFDANAGPRQPIMAAVENGNRISRYAYATSFCGQPFLTVDFGAKNRMVLRFYTPMVGDEYRRQLVRDYGIRYVFHGEAERTVGGWDPATASWLREVFRNDAATIYAVTTPSELLTH